MEKISVIFKNRLVGIIAISKKGDIYFEYDEEWLETGFSISPLSLPLENRVFKIKTNVYGDILGVFSDSLPDSWGQLLFKKYINKSQLKKEPNILDKLSYIGKSGMGALEYEPDKKINKINSENCDLDLIQKECNELLDSKEVNNIEKLYYLGGSSGGARPKVLITYENKNYIVKFASKFDDKNIANLEYEYCELALKCGINVANHRLLKTDKGVFFASERFDRNDGEKIHMISVAALLDIDFNSAFIDYSDLIKITEILTHNKNDVLDVFRRMVFNVYFDNQDDHTKNFSFLYIEKEHTYRLSPAYDLTPGKTYYGEHTTTINEKGKDITDEDLLEVAKECKIDLKEAKNIISKIKNIYKEYCH